MSNKGLVPNTDYNSEEDSSYNLYYFSREHLSLKGFTTYPTSLVNLWLEDKPLIEELVRQTRPTDLFTPINWVDHLSNKLEAYVRKHMNPFHEDNLEEVMIKDNDIPEGFNHEYANNHALENMVDTYQSFLSNYFDMVNFQELAYKYLMSMPYDPDVYRLAFYILSDINPTTYTLENVLLGQLCDHKGYPVKFTLEFKDKYFDMKPKIDKDGNKVSIAKQLYDLIKELHGHYPNFTITINGQSYNSSYLELNPKNMVVQGGWTKIEIR